MLKGHRRGDAVLLNKSDGVCSPGWWKYDAHEVGTDDRTPSPEGDTRVLTGLAAPKQVGGGQIVYFPVDLAVLAIEAAYASEGVPNYLHLAEQLLADGTIQIDDPVIQKMLIDDYDIENCRRRRGAGPATR